MDELEDIKRDLAHQLQFEDMDWQYFKDTVERAIEADEVYLMINQED